MLNGKLSSFLVRQPFRRPAMNEPTVQGVDGDLSDQEHQGHSQRGGHHRVDILETGQVECPVVHGHQARVQGELEMSHRVQVPHRLGDVVSIGVKGGHDEENRCEGEKVEVFQC